MTRVVGLPTRFAMERFNEAVAAVQRTGMQAREGAEDVAERVTRVGAGAREAAVTGRDAALGRAERVTRRDGATHTADAVHTTRRNLGTLRESELPIRGYDELNAQDAIAAARKLRAADDITAVVAYEEQHKNRTGVVSAAQAHFASVAKEAAGV